MTDYEVYDKFFIDEEYDLEKCTVVAYSYWSGWNSALKRASRIVHDEIRPQGEWEKCQNDMFRCSNCGQADEVPTAMGTPIYNFCPNCGANMQKGSAK